MPPGPSGSQRRTFPSPMHLLTCSCGALSSEQGSAPSATLSLSSEASTQASLGVLLVAFSSQRPRHMTLWKSQEAAATHTQPPRPPSGPRHVLAHPTPPHPPPPSPWAIGSSPSASPGLHSPHSMEHTPFYHPTPPPIYKDKKQGLWRSLRPTVGSRRLKSHTVTSRRQLCNRSLVQCGWCAVMFLIFIFSQLSQVNWQLWSPGSLRSEEKSQSELTS